MKWIDDPEIVAKYLIQISLHQSTTSRHRRLDSPLLFRVSNKNHGKGGLFWVGLIFFLFQLATILVAATLRILYFLGF